MKHWSEIVEKVCQKDFKKQENKGKKPARWLVSSRLSFLVFGLED